MNWKANDEGSAKGRLSGILHKQVRSRDPGSQCTYMLDSSDGRVDAALSYSFTPFLEQAILRTAQAFQHPTCFRDTPTSYTQSWWSGVSWCLISDTSMGGVTFGVSSIDGNMYFPLCQA